VKPVRAGDRGPAVEDIQRRLLTLGYDLGPTGIDGVFLGLTEDAVRAFQAEQGLSEDGFVGSQTWSTLVDETFSLGDRMLYLRLPHFHGRDVRTLQEALSALGFACGQVDAIFGAFTERAVREFQRNAGLPSDGIVGPETVGAIRSLKHVWQGKDYRSHSHARLEAARSTAALTRTRLGIGGLDDVASRVADRLVNLALAAEPASQIVLLRAGESTEGFSAPVLWLCGHGSAREVPGRPIVRLDDADALAPRLLTAVGTASSDSEEIVVELDAGEHVTEREEQRAAVLLLDAMCIAFD
jgi:peptidoglycan hydrolase-like protein with peptidoglycan-binding domain